MVVAGPHFHLYHSRFRGHCSIHTRPSAAQTAHGWQLHARKFAVPAKVGWQVLPRRSAVRCQAAARCHYEILGVSSTASTDEIKAAFRKLALQLHPDVNPAPDATERFKAAKDAYEVLSNPQQRRQYNQQRVSRARTRVYSSSGSSSSSSNAARSRQRSSSSSDDYVVYEYVIIDDEGDNEPEDMPGFHGWYSQSGSWQSSWQANRKKQKAQAAAAAAAAQQQQRRRRQQYGEAIEAVLAQLDLQTLQVVTQVFGQQLEHLDSFEELVELLSALELLRAQGIRPDPNMFRATRATSSSRSTARTSSQGSSSSKTSSTRSHGSRTNNDSSSNSSKASHAYRGRMAGRSSSTSSKKHQSRPAGGSSKRASSGSRSGKTPPFDEMSWEQLFEAMQDTSNPRAAAAARAWATDYAAMGANPYLAADLQALLTLDWLAEDWEAAVYGETGAQMGSNRAGSRGGGSSSWSGSRRRDTGDDDERTKFRSKVGSARDYVKYPEGDDGSGSDSDGQDVMDGVTGWLNLDDIIEQADAWCAEDDSDDYE